MFKKTNQIFVLFVISLLVVPVNSSFVLAQSPSPTPSCNSPGQYIDPPTGKCITQTDCPSGQAWSYDTDACAPTSGGTTSSPSPSPTSSTCNGPGQYIDPPTGKCITQTDCPSGQSWDYLIDACKSTSGGTNSQSPSPQPTYYPTQSCASGQYFDPTGKGCITQRQCASGEYWDYEIDDCKKSGTGSTSGSCPSAANLDWADDASQYCRSGSICGPLGSTSTSGFTSSQCPADRSPTYGSGGGSTGSNCGAGWCGPGEDYNNCPQDCKPGEVGPVGSSAPDQSPYTRPPGEHCGPGEYFDNSKNYCVKQEFSQNERKCRGDEYLDSASYTCKKFSEGKSQSREDCSKRDTSDLPEGCYYLSDQFGGCRWECKSQKRCAEDNPKFQNEIVLDCISDGGNPAPGRDPSGCPITLCEYGSKRRFGGPGHEGEGKYGFSKSGGGFCSSEDERKKAFKQCEKQGKEGIIDFEGGCPVVRCMDKDSFKDYEQRFDDKYKDLKKGEVPKEAYQACADEGGHIIELQGFVDCVREADEDEVFVHEDEVKRVPSATDLLDIALKLGELEVALDELVLKLDAIADYWEARASSGVTASGKQIAEGEAKTDSQEKDFAKEARRYQLAADIIESAKEDLKEIKEELRDRIDKLSITDVKKVLLEIRKIKDVRLKNAVKVMLAEDPDELKLTEEVLIDDDEAQKLEENGQDPEKYYADRFRNCATTTFSPDNSVKVHFEKKGENCYVEASGEFPGSDGKISMTCDVPGSVYPKADVREGPDDILPYCNGKMADMLKEEEFFGGDDVNKMPERMRKLMEEFGIKNPEEFQRKCPESQENAKKCLEVLGDVMPPEAKVFLTAIADGEAEAGDFGGMPKPIAELVKEFGLSSPEDLKDACPKSKENAQKCLDKLDKFLPPEAKFGLKAIAEGQFDPSKLGQQGSRGQRDNDQNPQFSRGRGGPREYQEYREGPSYEPDDRGYSEDYGGGPESYRSNSGYQPPTVGPGYVAPGSAQGGGAGSNAGAQQPQ